MQLLPPFPNESLIPPYGWISYREPEDHLDSLVEALLALPGVGKDSKIIGVSFKDQSVLDRLGRLGVHERHCLKVKEDLGAIHPFANIESVPSHLTPEKAGEIVARHGPADVVVARHVLEHAASPRNLIAGLAALLRDGGYLVLEVPDNEKNILRQDYTMIWEEHALYFTGSTFDKALSQMPFVEAFRATYPYRFEDVLVGVLRKQGGAAVSAASSDDAAFEAYVAAFPVWTQRYRNAITAACDGRPAALYGAGHLTAAFVNFHGLADLFAFVVDDTPEKISLRLPNSGLEIVPRERLVRDRVALCLFGLSPQIEDKVIANNPDYVRAGGRFLSIFADSSRSLRSICQSSGPV